MVLPVKQLCSNNAQKSAKRCPGFLLKKEIGAGGEGEVF